MKLTEHNVEEILREMTRQEKVDLITGKSNFSTQEIERLGIPSIRYLDGFTGLNMMQYLGDLMDLHGMTKKDTSSTDSNNDNSISKRTIIRFVTGLEPIPEDMPAERQELIRTCKRLIDGIRPDGLSGGCFPPGILTGSTWNPDIVYRCAAAVAREASAYGVDVLLGTPNVNIQRDPRGGRSFESYSEDPFLMKTMAARFVTGVQDQGVLADAKHFAVNNQETARQRVDAIVSERALREVYLPAFKAAVQAGCATVMSAYNKINGASCAHNPWLLGTLLRDEWGFEGQVVSDWGAVYDQVTAIQAGNDMDMPGPRNKERIFAALESGQLAEADLDRAVRNTLNMIVRTPKFRGRKYEHIDRSFSIQAAYDAAAEGIVLLKNDGLLPLSGTPTLSLCGLRANKFMECGSGSAQVDTDLSTNLVDEAVARLGAEHVLVRDVTAATDVVVITAGASGQEGTDRPDMGFNADDKAALDEALAAAEAAGKPTVLVLNIASPVALTDYVDRVDAILCVWLPGMEGGRAALGILFGDVNPSGRLPVTFPRAETDWPSYLNFPGEFDEVRYGEGIYVGYRYFDKRRVEPLYPFGFGLSYTTFKLLGAEAPAEVDLGAGLVAEGPRCWDGQPEVPVRVTVRNTGERAGKEVVQVYLQDVRATLDEPVKELKGFAKVALEPGETKEVTVLLRKEDFASWDAGKHAWTIEPGRFNVLVGSSSADTPLCCPVHVSCTNPYGYSRESASRFVFEDQRCIDICNEVLGGEVVKHDELISLMFYFGETPAAKALQRFYRKLGLTQEQADAAEEEIFTRMATLDVLTDED